MSAFNDYKHCTVHILQSQCIQLPMHSRPKYYLWQIKHHLNNRKSTQRYLGDITQQDCKQESIGYVLGSLILILMLLILLLSTTFMPS